MNSNRKIWSNLVAVEGIDGAGTTTLVKGIAQTLSAQKRIHAAGYEPTDGVVGHLIRKSLAGSTELTPETMALLFAADRREHLYGEGGIQETVEKGGIYITDRYLFSSLAYQSLETDWDWVDSLNSTCPLPGYLIYLRIPVKDAMERLSDRVERDIYETEDFQNRVTIAYERSINHYARSGMSILTLDSRRPPREMTDESLSFLAELLSESSS